MPHNMTDKQIEKKQECVSLLEALSEAELDKALLLLKEMSPKKEAVPAPIIAPAFVESKGEISLPMWYDKTVMYHIYPLGFCGAPYQNDDKAVSRINKVIDWIPHLKELSVSSVYFSPVFSSDNHGYDTRDYSKIDCRLGTNADFSEVCQKLHENGMRVVLDGVFNHVGRGFFAFVDVQKNREASIYKDWFIVNFSGNSNYNDGFWYEGWEGHFELVKLNLKNPAVVDYLLSCVKGWVDEFDIDGLRLDVAYSLEPEFIKTLRRFCKNQKPDFFLLGEMLHGDYNRLVNPDMLDSCTNYECYKGLFSSLNSGNLFELAHSLGRQFGKENWCIYRGKNLVCFGDNHDVSRLASILTNEKNLVPAYGLLFTMPGITCLYYGSEWGIKGNKSDGDNALRPNIEKPEHNALTDFIAALSSMKKSSKALCVGDFESLHIASRQLAFLRTADGERALAVCNAEDKTVTVPVKLNGVSGASLLTGKKLQINGSVEMPPFSFDCFGLS